jgi:PTH1 family peptidyl-tRNA hydrolase
MPLVVGLGNPGGAYQNTPHNIGFAVVEELARQAGVPWKRARGKSRVAKALDFEPPLIFLKPFAYMNRSGGPVQSALARYRMKPSELLVVCDDVNLPFGRLRLRLSGSAGGHKGLQSIIDALGTNDFVRLRIGVGGGEPSADLTDFVLRKFPLELRDSVTELLERAADAVLCSFQQSVEQAMNQYNAETVHSVSNNNNPPGETTPGKNDHRESR